MSSSPAERYEYAEYFSPSGAIACLVLYRTEQLTFVKFRTVDWKGYDGFSIYATTAIFPEHLRPADPHSPGVMNFAQALEKETAAQQQYFSNCRRRGNGQGIAASAATIPAMVRDGGSHLSKSKQGSGVKPSPEPVKPLARQRAGKRPVDNINRVERATGDVHSLKSTRTIGGLCLQDFLDDR
jgi:hypothetical protein